MATDLSEEQATWVHHVSSVLAGKPDDLRLDTIKVSVLETDGAALLARRERRRGLVIPREHGAWGLLLVPIATGAGLAFRESVHVLPLILLLTGALALFWARTPFESLLGTSAMRARTRGERRLVMNFIAGLGVVAAVSLGALLWNGKNSELWPLGIVAGLAFVVQGLLKQLGRRTPAKSAFAEDGRIWSARGIHRLRMLSEVVGIVGLTAAAPAAYYVITGRFDLTAWILWVANLIFAGNQIHYVQLRLHTARVEGLRAKLAQGWGFAAGQAGLTVALTMACAEGLLPKLASLAFAPLLFRGWFYFIQERKPLVVRRLGWTELAQGIAFGVLIIATLSPAL